MATSSKRTDAIPRASQVCCSPLSPWQATVDPCLRRRLLDPHRQVLLILLWGHRSVLLGPDAYRVLFVPSKSLFPQSCGSSVIKSHWPSKSNSLGVLSSFVGSQLGKSVWDLELLQQYENFFDLIVLQFVGRMTHGSVVGLLVTSCMWIYATRHASQVCCSQSP